MASAAFAKYEDSTLRKALAVTLDASNADHCASPPVLFLAELADELRDEAGDGGSEALLLCQDNVERALMARLSVESPAGGQWPVHYLISLYGRATDELRSVTLLKQEGQRAALTETLQLCRQLAVSYAGLTLTLDMFPQVLTLSLTVQLICRCLRLFWIVGVSRYFHLCRFEGCVCLGGAPAVWRFALASPSH